jgi:hypothetical protein
VDKETLTRPAFVTSGLPAAIVPAAKAQADRSWCVVSETGFSWFLSSRERADALVAALGGKATVFPPLS